MPDWLTALPPLASAANDVIGEADFEKQAVGSIFDLKDIEKPWTIRTATAAILGGTKH